jgi:hypothetical protein
MNRQLRLNVPNAVPRLVGPLSLIFVVAICGMLAILQLIANLVAWMSR